MIQIPMEEILELAASNFKYVLIFFNFLTIAIIYLHTRKNRPQKRHHILFVTAYPNDESIFFRPTIASLKTDYYIHLLCLSNGGDKERLKELRLSCENLGIHKFICLDDKKFRDGHRELWMQEAIRKEVLKYIAQNDIRAVFSFDSYGISGNQKHIAISKALNSLKSKIPEQLILKKHKESPEEVPSDIKFYTLESVNFLRKYSGIFDLLIAFLKEYSWVSLNILAAWKNISLHQSQFVGFKKISVLFSRYTYMNTYQRSFIQISRDGWKQA